jgi:hypothetical protein
VIKIKRFIILLMMVIILVSGCVINQNKEQYKNVNLYFIALSDNGVRGKKVAAEDSVVPIKISIEKTTDPIPVAYEHLLAIKDKDYEDLYNTLYQSDLKFDKVKVNDGEANIYLTGNLILGGELDSPRVKAQLEETALQFKEIKSVVIYINNKNLDSILSLKGEE